MVHCCYQHYVGFVRVGCELKESEQQVFQIYRSHKIRTMSGPTNVGGHQGPPGFPQKAASDEAPRSRTSIGSVAASEAEEKQDSTWGQGDVAIRGGSVWQNGAEVGQIDGARSGVRREKGVPGE